jgi:hypothetical protein
MLSPTRQAIPWPACAKTLEEIARPASTRRSGQITSPQRAAIQVAANGDTREVLNFCANNYLGLAATRRSSRAAPRPSTTTASAWPRCASSAAPRTCTRSSKRKIAELPRHGGHHPLRGLLRRQRRSVRAAAGPEDADHLRRAQPRLHHRRHPPVQGPAHPLRHIPTWRPGKAAGHAGRRDPSS